MILKNFNISLDINSSNIRKTNIEVVEGDNSVYNFIITMYNGSNVQSLISIDHSWIIFRKEDGNVVQGACIAATPNSGVLTYSLGTSEISFPGTVECELQLYGSSNQLITSSKFEFTVRDSLYSDDAFTSSSDYNAITTLINNVESAETTRTSNENTRISNENTRQSQEEARETNTAAAVASLENAVETTQVIPQPEVANMAALNALSPSQGWLVHVLNIGDSTSAYYRYNGSSWIKWDSYTNSNVDALMNAVFTPSYSTLTQSTAPITSLPSTALKGQLKASILGNTYNNILKDDGDCESTTPWSVTNATSALDSSNKVFSSNSIKITLTSTSGSLYQNVFSKISSTKYYFASAYLKNGNATRIILRMDTDGTSHITQDSSNVTGTSFTRVGIKVQPSDWGTGSTVHYIEAVVFGSVGQYAYVDGMLLTEITSDEYTNLTVSQLMDKYPFVNSTKSTTPVRVKSVGKNLVRNGNGEEGVLTTWSTYGGSTITRDTTNSCFRFTIGVGKSVYAFSNKVVAGQSYKISFTYRKGSSNLFFTIYGELGETVLATQTLSSASFATFSSTITPTQTGKLQLFFTSDSYADIKNIQLESGTTATTYEPYTESVAYIDWETVGEGRSVGNGASKVSDTIDVNNGVYTKNISNWVTLDGSKTWGFEGDYVGYKSVQILSDFTDALFSNNVSPDRSTCIKYNGLKLNHGLIVSSADYHILYGDNRLYISISDTDSGWLESWASGTSFTGMTWANLIKAYFYGWKLTTANTNVASCVWTGIASGTTKSGASGYNDVISTLDAGFTPYKMAYQLATPVVTYIMANTLQSNPSGSIIVENAVHYEDIYSSGLTIPVSSLPIKTLEYVNKITILSDNTRQYIPIDLTTCTVAGDGLSFTSSALSDGDTVEYAYFYATELSTLPTISYQYPNNLKAQVDGNTDSINQLSKAISDLSNYAITLLLDHEARIAALETP